MPVNLNGNIITTTDITSVGVFKSKVNSDGLICYLDAGNKNSYSGSGTTWYDLSGNGYNGTFTGGVTFDSSINGGVIITDGSTGYITVTTPSLVSNNYTIMGAAKYVSLSGRIFSAISNNWLLGWWGGTTENYFASGWVSSAGAGTSDTNWKIVSGTGNINDNLYSFYINGVQTISNSNGTAGPNGFSLGRYAPGVTEYSNSYISYLLVYNRVLSPYEIAENFQATRGRFGI
jgi:hypothetical protein